MHKVPCTSRTWPLHIVNWQRH